ncbi:hypothetical protein GCM10010472_39010 [Pseudonocardia halophobica]|uniref:Uncharacterized protein n=1 Tax=Pseudonocardia halophobica TaxID=29401 RepID=A0A9W6NVU6_9PSEU|nr:hypothetical protein GCM10017577_23450 [Pseudonocardia halophobica]
MHTRAGRWGRGRSNLVLGEPTPVRAMPRGTPSSGVLAVRALRQADEFARARLALRPHMGRVRVPIRGGRFGAVGLSCEVPVSALGRPARVDSTPVGADSSSGPPVPGASGRP